jgi:hypothetical protein
LPVAKIYKVPKILKLRRRRLQMLVRPAAQDALKKLSMSEFLKQLCSRGKSCEYTNDAKGIMEATNSAGAERAGEEPVPQGCLRPQLSALSGSFSSRKKV